MRNFSDFITEARKNYNSEALLSSEINKYLNKVNKKIPKNVQAAIQLSQQYNILDAQSLDEIRNANKSQLDKLGAKYGIETSKLEFFMGLLKDIKSNIRLMPQYQSKSEREGIELGKLSMDDLTIDLDSSAGRSAATKTYMPLVYKIVNQYVGKSRLSKSELISAGLEGFANAMNQWDREAGTSFKTYAGYRVQQQILNDINAHGHDLSGTSSYTANLGAELLDAVSIDGMMSGDDEKNHDRLAALGTTDADYNISGTEEKQWKSLYGHLEKQFNQRDMDIFYRYFGLNGYKREKSKDIAKSMGMSPGNIRNSIINKIIAFLKKDNKAGNILGNIQDIYNENLMVELNGKSKEEILEALADDDVFILLEEINRFRDKNVFIGALNQSLDSLNNKDKTFIQEVLEQDFGYLDSIYKKNKQTIIGFLSGMYPTENFSRKTDVGVLEYMMELQELYKKFNNIN